MDDRSRWTWARGDASSEVCLSKAKEPRRRWLAYDTCEKRACGVNEINDAAYKDDVKAKLQMDMRKDVRSHV